MIPEKAQGNALVFAALTFVAHLFANPHYGFFRDELYYIACGRYPAWGYVDQPPLVPLLAAASQLGGVSLVALRAVPALFAGVTIYVVCLLAAAFGGGRFAAGVAVLCTALAPVLMAFGTILIPDTVQLLLWPLGILCIVRALERDPVWWVAAGGVFGVAAFAKYSAVMLAVSLLAGIVVTGRGRALFSRYVTVGLTMAAVIQVPNFLWQWRHALPMLDVLQAGQHGKNVLLPPTTFLLQEVTITNPVLALVWIMGVAWCLAVRRLRWLGVGACALLGLMIVLHGKAYYPAAIYPALFAAGAVALEKIIAGRRVVRASALAAIAVFGAILVPMSTPLLPEPAMLAYMRTLAKIGLVPMENEHGRSAALGQLYADMHGWQTLADQVAVIARALPPEDRADVRVFAANYGEAAAIDVLAPRGALPRTLSGHNQYWEWGYGDFNGRVLIDVGGKLEEDRPLCASVALAGVFTAPYVMPHEDGSQIVLCRGVKVSGPALWERVKHFE